MRYMLFIYADEKEWDKFTPEQQAEAMGAYFAYTDALRAAGKYVSSDQLQPSATAKLVTVNDGKASVVDGPYVDIKEALGGYYLIDVETQAEAIEWARKCPGASHGIIEVRPAVAR
jgi:hypothetical protein